jgi:hypothetical protein
VVSGPSPRRPARLLAVASALAAAALLWAPSPRAARAEEGTEGPSITVYSSADPAGFDPQQFVAQQRQGQDASWVRQVPGFGVVKEVRTIDLRAGVNDLEFTEVAEFIDPTTVSFADLDPAAATAVLEQSFRFDLASPDKILERYLGETIGFETTKDGQVVSSLKGRVLSVSQGTVVLETEGGGLRFVSARDPGLRLPSLPKGLLTKPTLVWKVAAEAAGRRRVRTTYQTAGLTWKADYNLILDATDTKADLGAWVTLLNLSGAGYRNARLKLVAGDVQRIAAPDLGWAAAPAAPMEDAAGHGFEEKSFFEYHLYTLPRRTDVLENTTQQITLFPTARGAAVEKVLVYYGLPEAAHWGFLPQPRTDRDVRSGSNPKLDVYVRFRNEKANRLGMPLPRGKVRVYKTDDADGTLEFVGEDLIDHTPKDETVLVKVGQAFDVVGQRTQTDFTLDTRRRTMTDSYRITLRNHKDVPVKVVVRENAFRWTTWEMVQTSDPFTKPDARTLHFDVVVPQNGEKTVSYTLRYSW